VIVVEAKNNAARIDDAIREATEYADQINTTGRHRIKIAVGAAGEEDTGFMVEVRFLSGSAWIPLQSHGNELTTIPSVRETELALAADNGSTDVSVPANHEFVDAAIELSSLLRAAKVEAPLRPKVIGAIVLAMYQGPIDTLPSNSLTSINNLVETAISASLDIPESKKQKLIDALRLSGADFDRLAPGIYRVVSILRRLNVRAVLQTDTDFLGMFYEAFLRYGYDNNALGIVFTPRHITRYCIDLVGASVSDRVIDIACGTGGFLVAAFDSMMTNAKSQASVDKVKSSLYGFDTNPTVWALSMLNMFFRGDGKGHIELGSCFESGNRTAVVGRCTRAFLNPPFAQEGEPERDFIDASMTALEPEGLLAAVVYAGIFADDDHKNWRREFLRRHSLLAMISLPEDLFYPTAAPTSIIVAQAHVPQANDADVLMARVWNDGYEKLKGRRVEKPGSQLPEVRNAFRQMMANSVITSELATVISGSNVRDGAEWSPQQWLPQPHVSVSEIEVQQRDAIRSLYQAVAHFPEMADEALNDFGIAWSTKSALPLSTRGKVTDFFEVKNGRSTGEKNYTDGTIPYISSGDSSNSIIRLIAPVDSELFDSGGLTVTAFGTAAIQPWPFMARGNGGSAVRVLIPKHNLSFRELAWFAAQINIQRWRFFYARMSIKSRLERLEIESPPNRLPDGTTTVASNIKSFRDTLNLYSSVSTTGD
jgi:hypothetical protein